uniref:Uncharacterized protein n=1 Tax=Anguilla anguilla TaxID=7936 RepID=A0A0E9U4P0_ANGAN
MMEWPTVSKALERSIKKGGTVLFTDKGLSTTEAAVF